MTFRLNRRTVLKGAGSIAIALPWLEIMGHGRRASAQTASVPLKRFVTVYQPGGTVRAGTATSTRPPAARPRSRCARSWRRSSR